MSLFPEEPRDPPPPRSGGDAPLADRMRPRHLDEVAGQQEVLGEGSPIRLAVEEKRVPSLILWGPPGVGKTTIARLLAADSGYRFVAYSAVTSGVKEIRECVEEARAARGRGQRTLVFFDEIHRFNKAQQDALLPHVEEGLLTIVGATTENPSFEVNAALLSRCRVVALTSLADADLRAILQRAVDDRERGVPADVTVTPEAIDAVVRVAAGVEKIAKSSPLLYDKAGEEHYNLASALIKSLRGSDPDAAVYWMARMLESGEDPLFVARRLVIFAAEDVGNADPRALQVAIAAKDAAHFVGMPEGKLPLTQAALYLATAPKSNTALTTYAAAAEDVHRHGPLPTPLHLRNAPTGLMKDMGYGKDYKYPHDEGGISAQQHLPDALKKKRYFVSSNNGYEKTISERLAAWESGEKKEP